LYLNHHHHHHHHQSAFFLSLSKCLSITLVPRFLTARERAAAAAAAAAREAEEARIRAEEERVRADRARLAEQCRRQPTPWHDDPSPRLAPDETPRWYDWVLHWFLKHLFAKEYEEFRAA
jgi:hypothetical protein